MVQQHTRTLTAIVTVTSGHHERALITLCERLDGLVTDYVKELGASAGAVTLGPIALLQLSPGSIAAVRSVDYKTV